MKTPLTQLQRQDADNAVTSGKSLLSFINDILDFSKIKAGKMELEPGMMDLFQLAEQITDVKNVHSSEKKLELLLNIDPAMPRFAMANPLRLKQILINLLGNAIKFKKTGETELGISYFGLNEQEGVYRFSVRDTGIGITEKQPKRLFQAFSQADNSITRKYGGTGIWLVISNHHATKMESGTDQRIPVIALTAAGMSEDKEHCMDAGMNGFLSKPIDVHSLKEIFLTYLGGRKRESSPFYANLYFFLL